MSVSVSDRQRFETFSQQSGFGHQSRSTTAVIYQWWIPFSGDPSRDKLMYIYQLTNRSTEQFMQNRKQVKYLLNCPTLKNDTQARFHVLYLLRAQCFFFFCYISVHKKPHKVKVHIATVAPEFNVTPWPKQKSAKNRAQNSVQSNIFFKNNTRTKMFLLNQILFFQ